MSPPNPVSADGYNAQVLSELREQSKLLKSVDEKLTLLVNHLGAGKRSGGARSRDDAEVATDDELDGRWGNPEVKRDPTAKYWEGESFMGTPFSDCPSDYLEALARYKEASAFMKEKQSPDDETQMKYARYDRRDAKLARGWALRNKGRSAAPTQPTARSSAPQTLMASDDDIPF